jgi:hypothetical protein
MSSKQLHLCGGLLRSSMCAHVSKASGLGTERVGLLQAPTQASLLQRRKECVRQLTALVRSRPRVEEEPEWKGLDNCMPTKH